MMERTSGGEEMKNSTASDALRDYSLAWSSCSSMEQSC